MVRFASKTTSKPNVGVAPSTPIPTQKPCISLRSNIDRVISTLITSLPTRITTFVGNVLITVFVFVRLAFNRRNLLHVLHEEFHRPWAPDDVVCIYTTKGRHFFIKDGTLNPKVINNMKVFEKMKHSQKSAYGKSIGSVPTLSGDDPIRWRLGKAQLRSLMRPSLTCPGASILDILESVSPAVTDFLGQASDSQNSTFLYRDLLRTTVAQVFSSMMGSHLQDYASHYSEDILDRITDHVDRVANAGVEAKLKQYDEDYGLFIGIVQAALTSAPSGTFGYELNKIRKDGSPLPENFGLCNAIFYWIAIAEVSTNVVSHFVLTMHRHPEHLQRCLCDRTYFRMCLKECLRLFPPVTKHSPRRSKVTTQLGNVTIPPRSFVFIFPTLQIKDTTFCPDRWHDNCDITDAHVENAESVYIPFSVGTRACLMRSLAMRYLVSNLILSTKRMTCS